MTGISIETTLELWASSLRAVKARMAPLFTQERVAASAGLFLFSTPDGLIPLVGRKWDSLGAGRFNHATTASGVKALGP